MSTKQFTLNFAIVALFACGILTASYSNVGFSLFSKESAMLTLAFIMSYINNIDME
jgi:hypothetical protein